MHSVNSHLYSLNSISEWACLPSVVTQPPPEDQVEETFDKVKCKETDRRIENFVGTSYSSTPKSCFKVDSQHAIPLKDWVEKTFKQQNPSPENISTHTNEYEQFRNYLSLKGDYVPHPDFVHQVFELIKTYRFDIHNLRHLELLIFENYRAIRMGMEIQDKVPNSIQEDVKSLYTEHQ